MGEITTIGLDLAKQVFQVPAVDAAGQVVLRRALRRGQVMTFFAGLPRCLIGMEACATAHFWGRELTALGRSRSWQDGWPRSGASCWPGASPASRRLATIPGIGPVTASTLTATVGDPAAFRSGREFAALRRCAAQRRSLRDRIDRAAIDGSGWCRGRARAAASRVWAGSAARRQRSPPPADHRRPGRAALAEGRRGQPLAEGIARPPAASGRGGRPGQQARAHRPSAGKRRPLLRRRIDRAAVDGRCRATAPSSGPRRPRSHRVGISLRGQQRVMVDRSSDAARATWFVHRAIEPAKLSRPRIAEPIRAGGHRPRQRPDT
jgi:Transposase IS116/IS110/IS902 family